MTMTLNLRIGNQGGLWAAFEGQPIEREPLPARPERFRPDMPDTRSEQAPVEIVIVTDSGQEELF